MKFDWTLNLVNQSVEFAKKKVGFPMLSQILKELVSWGGGANDDGAICICFFWMDLLLFLIKFTVFTTVNDVNTINSLRKREKTISNGTIIKQNEFPSRLFFFHSFFFSFKIFFLDNVNKTNTLFGHLENDRCGAYTSKIYIYICVLVW